jgi:hypothetical protein
MIGLEFTVSSGVLVGALIDRSRVHSELWCAGQSIDYAKVLSDR